MADIIVADITPRVQYTAGAGLPTVFSYSFAIFADTDLNVYLTPSGSTASDVSDILTYNVDYTVTNATAPTVGGVITLMTGANAGDVITIVRNMPDNRLNNYLAGGLFQATDVNTDFDKTVMMAQQNTMYDKVVAAHYNLSAQPVLITDTILPVLGANECWVKNNSNTAIVARNFNTGGGGGGGSGDLDWEVVTISQTMVANTGYIVSAAIILTLPATLIVGEEFAVTCFSNSFTIAQQAGQQIRMGTSQTTVGVAGSLASTQLGDTVKLVAVSTAKLHVISGVGSITVV